MIEPILGSKSKEIILMFTLLNEEYYPSQLSKLFKIGHHNAFLVEVDFYIWISLSSYLR